MIIFAIIISIKYSPLNDYNDMIITECRALVSVCACL
jgi:hypothetical protein